MSRIRESLTLFHQILRTLLLLIILAAIGGGSYFGYTAYRDRRQSWDETQKNLAKLERQVAERDQRLAKQQAQLAAKEKQVATLTEDIKSLNRKVAEQQQQIEKLDIALRLLKVQRRVAQLRVLDEIRDPDSGAVMYRIEFVELDDEGKPVETPKRFTVTGEMIYVDSWVVKFEDRYVESAALDRATSLVVFRRLFTDKQKPEEGFSLDPVGSRPTAYGGNRPMSDLEKKIWSEFWTIATDEAKAKELGIRAAHGEAPSVPLKKGIVYRIELRASDGLTIRPDTEATSAATSRPPSG